MATTIKGVVGVGSIQCLYCNLKRTNWQYKDIYSNDARIVNFTVPAGIHVVKVSAKEKDEYIGVSPNSVHGLVAIWVVDTEWDVHNTILYCDSHIYNTEAKMGYLV